MFDILIGSAPKCPDCGKRLVSEENLPDGMLNKAMWDSVYNSVYLFRRPRFVCMNKNCSSYYPKTRRRYLRSLAPGQVVCEHFFDEALRTKGGKKHK